MQKHHILIIDDFHADLLSGLKTLNVSYHYIPNIKASELLGLENVYSGLLVRSKCYIDKKILSHFSKLQFIARGGAGMDGIDLDYAKELGLNIFNAPEGNRDAVAEHTVAAVLAWHTKLLWANESVQSGVWDREAFRGSEIKNKVIGIIGFGNTGKEVARRWKSFGCEILCYDIDANQYDETLAKAVELPVLQKKADVLSFHIPLLNPNRHMVNSRFISEIKSSSLLVNMSRGEIFNTLEVLQSLKQNRIAGLCLDVIEGEQKNGFPTLDVQSKMLLHDLKDRIIITPHVAGWTTESYQKIAQVILQKITNYILKGDEKKQY